MWRLALFYDHDWQVWYQSADKWRVDLIANLAASSGFGW